MFQHFSRTNHEFLNWKFIHFINFSSSFLISNKALSLRGILLNLLLSLERVDILILRLLMEEHGIALYLGL